jgi:ABC-type dipeptide/oligopeptide/nickel transport system permease subunit
MRRAPVPQHPAAGDGAGQPEHGLGDPERRGPELHRPGRAPADTEWGILVAEGAQFIVSGEWWVSFFPGAVLMLAVFSFNLLGDALRDIFDPRKSMT